MIYFADDDNSYDVRIFEEIRRTARVSVFPVGLVLKYGVSAPIVRGGAVTGFYDAFQAGRVFAMDMAGFAVSVKLFKSRPKATFPAKVSLLEENVKVYYHWVLYSLPSFLGQGYTNTHDPGIKIVSHRPALHISC